MERDQIKWFGISLLILAVLAYLADFNKLIQSLRSAKPSYIILALIFGILPLFVWGFSWYRFVNKVGLKISYRKILPIYLASNFMNAITPLGQFGGEPFMAYILSKNTELPYEKAFPAVLSADMINYIPRITLGLTGTIFLVTSTKQTQLLEQLMITAITIATIGTVLTYLLWFKTTKVEKTILYTVKKITATTGKGKNIEEKIKEKMEGLKTAFQSIGENPKHLLTTATTVHLAPIFNIIVLYLILLSLGITPNILILVFILPLTSISNISPTPGAAGAYEAVMTTLLTTLLPIGLSQALATSIIFRFTTYGPGLTIGYLSLAKIQASK